MPCHRSAASGTGWLAGRSGKTFSEAFFMNFEAAVELTPVMNREDLKKGLAALAR